MTPNRFLPLLTVFLTTGCATFGPTIRIETPEPTEDYVVICTWVKHGWLDFHGGKKLSDEKIYVTESGKNLDCGLSLWGGEGGARIFHPLYTRMQGVDEDGVSVIRPTNKLDILDELKARFEAGEWDDYRNPGRSYLGNRPGCGFPHQYFDYYSEVKDIDMVDRGRRD